MYRLLLLLPLFVACDPASPTVDKADDDSGITTDTETTDTPENQAPGAAEVAISPENPLAGLALTVTLVSPAVDPDDNIVSYRYTWAVDGVATDLTTNTVVPGTTENGQVWEVTVTPTDGLLDGPSSSASARIGNEAPTTPGLTFSPSSLEEGQDLELVFDPESTDADGDPLTTQIVWFKNGVELTAYEDTTLIPGSEVVNGDTFTVRVVVSDAINPPLVVEAAIAVGLSCDTLPSFNLGDQVMEDASAYHGITFDPDGNLIGWDGRSLVKSRYDGTSALFVPGFGSAQQMDRLPDGSGFVVVDDGNAALVNVYWDGSQETVAGGIASMYGVTVGPDGWYYVANGNVLRVNPHTGEQEVLADGGGLFYAHSINFNLDSTRMYIGTIGNGSVYYMDFDADMVPLGEKQVFARSVGGGYHDGIEVDACGNLYVADYSTSSLYRVSPDGATVTEMVRSTFNLYGHGVVWGSGIDGWRDDTLYQPQPYNGNTVREVQIGFHSGDTVRTWNGALVGW